MGLELILLATAGMLLMYGWLIVKTAMPGRGFPAAPEPVKASRARSRA